MALYKYTNDVAQATANNECFEAIHNPGEITPRSGVYRCQSCAVEIVSEQHKPFPPTRACREHNPNANGGSITWRMVVYAQHAR